MSTRADGVRVAYPLFNQGGGGGAKPTSALQLRLEPIDFADAKALNRLWHSRLPRLGTGAIANQPFPCFGAEYDWLWYAAGIWSPPVARNLPQDWSWLELRRLAVAPDAPRNTPSRMLRVMALLLRRARPNAVRLISYQDTEVHTGAIYRAAGWLPTTTGGGGWNRPSRHRPKAQSEALKQCWDRCLVCSMTDPSTRCEKCRERIPDPDEGRAAQGGVRQPGDDGA